MRKFLKPFVLVLLLIVVPFQGYAAAAMLCCGSADIEGSAHAAVKLATQRDVHPHLADLTRQRHDSAPATEATSVAESDSGAHHHAGDSSERAAFKCGACASCCGGAALVQTSVQSIGAAPLTSVRIAFTPQFFYRFVPDTPERPPYRLIA